MAEIPRDLNQLAKQISDFRVEGSDDIRKMTELCRALAMDVSEIFDLAAYEIQDVLRWFDRGSTKRANQVTRPLRHSQMLVMLAARRSVQVYRTYQKAFADEIARTRKPDKRRFDPEK